MNFRRTFPAYSPACLAALGFAVGGVVGGCNSKNSTEVAREALKNEAKAVREKTEKTSEFGDILTTNSKLQGPDAQGRLLWEVKAREIRARDEKTDANGKKIPRQAQLKDASATLYRAGKPESTFRAQTIQLIYLAGGVQMRLSGGVHAHSSGVLLSEKPIPGGISLEAPLLSVDLKSRRVVASQGAKMKSRGATVSAKHVTADSSLGVAQLSGGVRAVAPEGEAGADKGTWNWNTGRAQASGHVTLKHDGTTVTGARLDADTNATRGVLSGDTSAGVRVVAAQGNASASQIAYNWKGGSIKASGGVILSKDGATLRAARVDSDDKLNGAVASGDVRFAKDDIKLRAARVIGYDKMTRAVASGGIVLTRGDSTARAAQATVWVNQKRAIATGDVRLQRGELNVAAARVEAVNFGEQTALRVAASGAVRAQNGDGAVSAARVNWGGGRVVATGNVTLRRGQNVLRGQKLESDDRFQRARLEGDIGGAFAGGGSVSAGILLWRADGKSAGDGTIEGRGGVRVRRDDMTLRADRFEASGDGMRATLTGNVVATRDDGSVVRAPHVRYDKAQDKIWATGGVSYEDPKRGLRQTGKTLVADLKLEEATLTDARGSGKLNVLQNKKLF